MAQYKAFEALGLKARVYYVIQKYSWFWGWSDYHVTYNKMAWKRSIKNLIDSGHNVVEG